MKTSDQEYWKIVKIIDDYQVVVNAGANQGIKQNDELEVFVPGEKVVDPDSGAVLGSLDLIKCYLKVKYVYPNLCLCINSETQDSTMLDAVAPLSKILKSSPKKLPIDPSEVSGMWKNTDGRIHIGDYVRRKIG